MRRPVALTAVVVVGLVGLTLGARHLGSSSVVTLAEVDGWREGVGASSGEFGVLEVAYDADTAQALWDDDVPTDAAVREGQPLEEGRYGDLGDVDFSEQAVALWSSGQSGSCPGWAACVMTRSDGEVVITRDEDLWGGDGCTDDDNPYRVVIAVDRDDLPQPADLAAARAAVAPGGSGAPLAARVVVYPLT